MSGQPRRGRGPGGGRFLPAVRPGAIAVELTEAEEVEQKAEWRLARTLEELIILFDEAKELASRGKPYFEKEWGGKRVAKDIITELQETLSRLPISYRERYPDIEWALVRGMRNRVVHEDQDTDDEIVWKVIVASIPEMRDSLGL